jgi:hypothetical protein
LCQVWHSVGLRRAFVNQSQEGRDIQQCTAEQCRWSHWNWLSWSQIKTSNQPKEFGGVLCGPRHSCSVMYTTTDPRSCVNHLELGTQASYVLESMGLDLNQVWRMLLVVTLIVLRIPITGECCVVLVILINR